MQAKEALVAIMTQVAGRVGEPCQRGQRAIRLELVYDKVDAGMERWVGVGVVADNVTNISRGMNGDGLAPRPSPLELLPPSIRWAACAKPLTTYPKTSNCAQESNYSQWRAMVVLSNRRARPHALVVSLERRRSGTGGGRGR
jgi:hypothetical protein